MRWPWRRNRRDETRDDDPVNLGNLAQVARSAEMAKEHADAALEATRQQAPEVREVAQSLQRLHVRNRFGEMMYESFQRKTHG